MDAPVSAHVRSDEDVRALSLTEKQALVRRFNDRVDSAVAGAPPTKQWVKTALARGGAPRCPTRLRRLSYDLILRYGDALADLFVAYPDDTVFALAYDLFIGYQPADRTDRIDPVTVLTGDARWADEWGTEWQHVLGGVGASPVANPLPDWSGLDGYLANRIPDAHVPGRLDGALPAVSRFGPTNEKVSDHVRRSIDTLGRRCGNAYIAAPSNVLLPDVPLANLEALFEACHNP